MADISKKVILTAVQRMKDDQIIRDTELKDLGVRTKKGRPSYFLQNRVKVLSDIVKTNESAARQEKSSIALGVY